MEKRKPKTAAPKSATSGEKTPKSSTEIPSPLELERFVPWKFAELQSNQTVVINKIYQEDINPRRRYTTQRYKNSPRNSQASVSSRQTDSYTTLVPFGPTIASTATTENEILLTIYYNRAGQVVEIAIKDCPFPINGTLIETISLCLPFHALLNKLTCKGKCLDYSVIDQIVKILPHSNLTDICLDNTFVPQGNYYILLDQASTLKSLSLSKCKINDIVCQKIAKRLEYGGPASKNLRILCLSCNFISNVGARALGQSLRTNRYIVHLNLCGNSITTVGAGHLLEALTEFPLTKDEIREKIRIRSDYLKVNTALIPIQKSPINTSTDLRSEMGKTEKGKSLKIVHSPFVSQTNMNCCEQDKKLVEDDVFGSANTVYRNGCWFAVGNLTLSSLNLAYNGLDYTSLLKIVEVLSYQKDQEKGPRRTGLLRIVIEGNYLPNDCEEYSKIEALLGVLNNGVQSSRKQKKFFELRKVRRTRNINDINSFSSPSTVDPMALSSSKTKNQV